MFLSESRSIIGYRLVDEFALWTVLSESKDNTETGNDLCSKETFTEE